MTEHVIRPSYLPSWSDCSRRTAARLFADLIKGAGYELRPLPSTVGATVGSAVHASASYTLEHKRDDGTLGHEDEALDRAMAEFDRRAEEDGCLYDATTNSRNTAQQQIRRMSHSYRTVIAPELQPVLVEERLEVESGDGFVLSGQMDSLSAEPHRIRDVKSGVRRRANAAQYGAYSMIARAHGHDVRQLAEDFIPRVRLDKPQPDPETHLIPIDVAEQEAWEIIADIRTSVSEFVRRVGDPNGPPPNGAFRANPMSQLCTDRYCAAWGTDFCRSHKGAR